MRELCLKLNIICFLEDSALAQVDSNLDFEPASVSSEISEVVIGLEILL